MKLLALICLIAFAAASEYCPKNGIWCSDPANLDDYPFFINFYYHCAGILIDDRWLMTVAHGWNPGNQAVYLAGANYDVLALYTLYGHDTVLIYLDRPVEGMTPIPWRTTNNTCNWLFFDKTPVRILGPGDDSTEKEEYTVGQADVYMDGVFDENHNLLAFSNEKHQAATPGDSGGPAFIYQDGKPFLIGMVTSGNGPHRATGVTCIAWQKDWIYEKMEEAKALDQ